MTVDVITYHLVAQVMRTRFILKQATLLIAPLGVERASSAAAHHAHQKEIIVIQIMIVIQEINAQVLYALINTAAHQEKNGMVVSAPQEALRFVLVSLTQTGGAKIII